VLRVPLQKVSDGITIFVQDNVERLAATNTGFKASTDQDTRRDIVKAISGGANGMFLWARIVWDDFQRGLLWSAAIVRQKLATINTGPSSITAVYDKLMDQIDPSVQDAVWSILSILSIAVRPMKPDELAIVLAVSTADRRMVRSTDLDCIQNLDSVIADNLPDIITFHDDHTISFSHLSFKEYLETTWRRKFPETFTKAERLIARTCLQYVNLRDLLEEASDEEVDLKGNARFGEVSPTFWSDGRKATLKLTKPPTHPDLAIKYPFLAYSRTYLDHHLFKMAPDDSLWLLFADLAGASGPFHCRLLGDGPVRSTQGELYRHWRAGSPLQTVLGSDGPPVEFPVMETLIRNFAAHGYDVSERWRVSWSAGSPLYRCCWRLGSWPEYGNVVILLLRLGADPRLPRDRFKPAIEYVVEAGRWDVLDAMVSHPRYDPGQQDARGRCVLHYFVRHGATSKKLDEFLEKVAMDPNIQDSAGDAPLHLAASAGNTTLVRSLLNVPGIRLDLTDGQGRTPLGISTYWGMRSTSLCFLEHSKAFPTPEQGHLSPLCFAAKHGDLDMCLRLLEACNYECLHLHLDTSGKGILHLAAINNWSDVLQKCLKKGDAHLNINQIDHSGGTALHSAARLGNTESCRVLIEHGANLQLQDRLGRTAAQAVADAGFRDTFMVLLRSGRIDPNQRDHQGRNLVHWAATLDCVDVMELILAIPGVELARRDGDGAMPIDIAKRCMSASVGNYLGQEMQRRGIDSRWCVGFGWDMMYRSPEVTVQPGDKEFEHQGMDARGYRRDLNGLAEWEKIHRDYPEDMWALCEIERSGPYFSPSSPKET
jgi:ankyrin repeat protein